MESSMNFDWDSVKNLGNSTKENFNKFEEARAKIIEIADSIPECWEGLDANAFVSSVKNYMEVLKSDTEYFDYLGDYFDKVSNNIGGVVETYGEKFTRIDEDLSRQVRPLR